MTDLSTNVDSEVLPKNEGQARPLTRLKSARHRKQAWRLLLTYDDSTAIRSFYSWACPHAVPARYQLDMAKRRRALAQELILTPVGLG